MRTSIVILGQLDDLDTEWIQNHGTLRQLEAGAVLIREGEPTEALFLILDGRFSVLLSTDQEEAQEVAEMSSGDIVGEISFVDQRPPSATVKAATAGVVVAIGRDLLRQRLEDDEGFAARFYRAIAIFLSDKLRRQVGRFAAGRDPLDEDVLSEDELDPAILERAHLAGLRFQRIQTHFDR